jgi:signal transduction histidine kinase/streptogramin lyase
VDWDAPARIVEAEGGTVTVYDSGDGLVAVTEVYYLRSTHDGRMSLRGRPASLACQEFLLTTKSGADQNAILRLQTPPSLCLHDLLQDKRKNWWTLRWIAERKIYKLIFIPVPNPNFSASYELTAADGWVDGLYTALYEDHEGYLWLRTGTKIFRVEYAKSGRPRVVEIVKEGSSGHAFRFFRDPSGAIWWTNGATVWRQQNGKIATIQLSPNGVRPSNFFADRKGRLWISTVDAGVFMTETPASAQPRFIQYTTANGLLNDYVEAVCEDDAGRMWFATMRGLCWLDVATGRFSPFAVDDNTLGAAVRDLRKDARGHLWASLMGAVVRINPHVLPPPSSQTSVYFNRITIAGEPLAFGEIGATSLAPLELAAASNNLDIEFLSPNFRGDNAVRYQYKLDSVDADWSVPSNVREVNYARLASGQYTFLARAVNEAGLVSREPARLSFTILRPVWQRWWFLATLAIGLGALIYGGYRYRLGQAVKVERVRTRIAHDLHDDIGANLTRISILSEVAKRQQYNSAPPPGELPSGLLDSIADISRESVAAMNDIVWAINPEHDSLIDLTSRMRRHAEEVFLTRDIRLDFEAPGDAEQLKLDIETRRDLYLVFKEAVNNAARHAGCSVVSISVQASATHIQMNIRDNGKGFDPSALAEGNGLLSMRNRAQQMKGKLKIESSPGKGSELSLTVPVLPA